MRFARIAAHSFGPLRGEELELARGLTVIWGPNESAKSSWHAALYAGLCGRRRGRGAQRSSDELFERRHRPWVGDGWRVGTVIDLDDGRTIELIQDLDARTGTAMDTELGREVHGEIVNEGAPDGSLWLGLDRNSFVSTACVRQNEVLRVSEDPELLQELLQRAATTLDGTETAGSAISRIGEYRRENVGLDRSNSVRPLRVAKERVAAAEANLEEARRRHRARGDLLTALDGNRRALERNGVLRARRDRDAVEAELAEASARYEDLNARLEAFGGQAPPRPSEDDELVAEVQAALAALEHAPSPVELTGPDVAELRSEIDSITENEAEVDALVEDLSTQLEEHRQCPPEPPSPVEVAAAAITVLSRRLDDPSHSELDVVEDAEAERERSSFRRRALVGAALSATGMGLALVGLVAALILLPVGAGLASYWLWRSRPDEETLERMRRRQAILDEHEAAMAELEAEQERVRTSLAERGLPTDMVGLGDWMSEQRVLADLQRQWHEREAELRAELLVATSRIEKVQELRAALDERRADERRAAEIERVRQEIGERVMAAASVTSATTGGPGPRSPEDGKRQLVRWLELRTLSREQVVSTHERWIVLEAELAETPLVELQAQVESLRDRLAGMPDPETPPGGVTEDLDNEREQLRSEEARLEAELAHSELADGVADCEAELADAVAELERVEGLAFTLDATVGFLSRAQDRAHRMIAPKLAGRLSPWVQHITEGRYRDIRLDPETLEVRVRRPNGDWVEADRLSHGTTEQLYLLLRVALAEVVCDPSESCPLILDDVAVHADAQRTDALLQLASELAGSRQVIWFSQENEVLEWARLHLDSERDRLITLGRVADAA